MNINDFKHGLEILFRYNGSIRHKLLELDSRIDYYTRHSWKLKAKEISDLCNEIISNINSFLKILGLEEHVERLIKKVDKRLYQSLRQDTKQLENILLELKEHLERILQSKDFLSKNNISEIKRFITASEEILSRDIYLENLTEEVTDHIKTEWERNIKEKSD